MMQNAELLDQVIHQVLGAVNMRHVDPKTVTAQTSLREGGLELDSVDLLEVIVTIEHSYNLKVADAEVGKKYFRTIGTIVDFIEDSKKPA